MGSEARCTLTLGRKKADGRALLETDALIFRSEAVKLSIPYGSMTTVEARDGVLRVRGPHGLAAFELGSVSTKWADRILHPPTRLHKMGIKPAHTVVVLGIADRAFDDELRSLGCRVIERLPAARSAPADVVVFGADTRASLDQFTPLQQRVKRDGAIWVIRPKGSPAISEADVMKAGKAAGLVDVKVVRFSDTHTAEKFVIPVARR